MTTAPMAPMTPLPAGQPVSPTSLGKPAAAAVSSLPAATDSASTGFAALVAGLLAGQAGAPGLTAPATGLTGTGQAEEPGTVEGGAEGTEEDAVGADPLPVLGLAALLRSTVVTEPTARPAGGAAGEVSAEGPAGPSTAPAAGSIPGEAGEGATDEARPAATGTASASPATPAAPATATAVDASPAPVASVTVSSATTPTTAASAAPAASAAAPVTQQVFPEITRLATAGNGTHRLTMTLQPEQLGEVRVTLTVRQGEVHVRLAAGDEAQQALLEGAPELRRILELTGATDTRVVVRDLQSGATTSPAPAFGAETRGDADLSGRSAEGNGDDTDHQHAGTRGGAGARDGSHDEAVTPRPDPVAHARTGVDVTM
ncbi:flagellar hook-length control protein FliK [Nocardioides sp. GCM10027113]|uniref:flagellar hook-length control protein FliK n=1 Tax=unclassified Nocardioides TaxID=2615069 RepID=UPI003614BF58